MSQSYDGDADLEIVQEMHVDIMAVAQLIAQSPDALAVLVDALRDELIVNARLTGDLFGKWAQKPTPIGVQPQPPATQRIY